MLVNELIQMLCDDTDTLITILMEKRSTLTDERERLNLRILNLNKVLRIAFDVKSRCARNEREIGELHEELDDVGEDGELDLTDLYMLTAHHDYDAEELDDPYNKRNA